jgi:hypothetical protein
MSDAPAYVCKVILPEQLADADLHWWERQLDRRFACWYSDRRGCYHLPVPTPIVPSLQWMRAWRQLVERALGRFGLAHLSYHYVRTE